MVILLHDNRPHVVAMTFTQLDMSVTDHLPDGHDLVPLDFPKFKAFLERQRLENDDVLQETVTDGIKDRCHGLSVKYLDITDYVKK